MHANCTDTHCQWRDVVKHNDRFISLSHCIPSQHPIMCAADSCTVGCVFMFHDLFALIKVTQNHNEVCMDTSYCCHLTTTHTFSTHLHHLCHVQWGFNNDTTEGKFAIFVRQPHIHTYEGISETKFLFAMARRRHDCGCWKLYSTKRTIQITCWKTFWISQAIRTTCRTQLKCIPEETMTVSLNVLFHFIREHKTMLLLWIHCDVLTLKIVSLSLYAFHPLQWQCLEGSFVLRLVNVPQRLQNCWLKFAQSPEPPPSQISLQSWKQEIVRGSEVRGVRWMSHHLDSTGSYESQGWSWGMGGGVVVL